MAKAKTGGRKKGTPNKNTADLKALAGKHGPWALKAIRHLAEHAEAEQVRLSACRELLDRVLGKPESIDFLERMEKLEGLLDRHASPSMPRP